MNSYKISVPERGRRAKQKPPAASATTRAIIAHLLRVADPDRRGDPDTDTTMLEMMRVHRRTIREVVGGVR